MAFPSPIDKNPQVFNNADSFAMAFDKAWERSCSENGSKEISQDKKIELALSQVSDHPFSIQNPSMAKEVANFRVRLLSLK